MPEHGHIARLGHDNSEHTGFGCHDKLSNVFKEMMVWVHKMKGKKKRRVIHPLLLMK